MPMNILTGHYLDESGSRAHGKLILERREDKCIDESGYPVRAAQFKVSADIVDVEITSTGPDVYKFVPASGECERIGLQVEPLI